MSLFIGTEKAGRSLVQKKKERENEREAIVMVGSFAVRSLGAEGELLQVMDALLVNQTDGKGGEIQDEAFVEL